MVFDPMIRSPRPDLGRAKCPRLSGSRKTGFAGLQAASLQGVAPRAPRGQASVSAQMLRAQPWAYLPSSSLAALDTPPEPGTVSMVFFSAS